MGNRYVQIMNILFRCCLDRPLLFIVYSFE
jgi:hypothetical protein